MSSPFYNQALFQRHEEYVEDAERDRSDMVLKLQTLEYEKQQAEQQNVRILEDNRELLKQLQSLNRYISASDEQIKKLTDMLEGAEGDMRRMATASSRVDDLETHIDMMQAEGSELCRELEAAKEDRLFAITRWKDAESHLKFVKEELEKVEREAMEEREHHAEAIERLKRQNAGGRFKHAPSSSVSSVNNGVSDFMRDILQDNARLQADVVELNSLLATSHEDVEHLQEELRTCRQVDDDAPPGTPQPQSQNHVVSLGDELEDKSYISKDSQEIHVHHHYHSQPPSTPQLPAHGRKKKRQTPLRGRHLPQDSMSSISSILSPTSPSLVPRSHGKHVRRSHSVVSSCSSESASVFDYTAGFDSSRPTSPESSCRLSQYHSRYPSNSSFRSGGPPFVDQCHHKPTTSDESSGLVDIGAKCARQSIPEEKDDGHYYNSGNDDSEHDFDHHPPRLRSAAPSHKSRASSRPPSVKSAASSKSLLHLVPGLHDTIPAPKAVNVTVEADIDTIPKKSSLSLLSTVAESSLDLDHRRGRSTPPSSSSRKSRTSPLASSSSASSTMSSEVASLPPTSEEHEETSTGQETIGKRIGSWFRGKWGGNAQPSASPPSPVRGRIPSFSRGPISTTAECPAITTTPPSPVTDRSQSLPPPPSSEAEMRPTLKSLFGNWLRSSNPEQPDEAEIDDAPVVLEVAVDQELLRESLQEEAFY